jgi:hypothetical protein
MSLLESIPGVAGIINRYFAFPGDAGVMFVDNTYVTFKQLPGGPVEIKLPVMISVAGRRRVNIRENDDLEDPIKFITKSVVIDVTLAGSAGTWRKATLPSIPAVPGVGGAVSAVVGMFGTILGTSEYTDKIEMLEMIFNEVLKGADGPIEIEDMEGFLDGHDITHVVPLDYHATPQLEEVAWVMRFVADANEDPLELIFPEEGAKPYEGPV